MTRFALALIATLGLGAASAPVEAEPAEAAALRAASEALTEEGGRAALGQAIRANEQAMARLRDERRRLALLRGQAATRREAAQARLDPSLRLLLSLRRAPLPGLLDHPDGPQAAVIAGSLAATLAEGAQSEIQTISELTERIDTLEAEARELEESLTAAQEALYMARDSLAAAPAPGTAGQAPDGIAAALLLANSESLSDLSDVLADLDLPETPLGACAPPLAVPVTSPATAQTQGDGMQVRLRPGQIVTAPCTGVVRFAAPFPGHGEIVILETAPGLLFILGGFGRVYVEPGATVPVDAPLGSIAAGTDGVQPAALYIEVRRDNQAQAIEQWFRSNAPGTQEETP